MIWAFSLSGFELKREGMELGVLQLDGILGSGGGFSLVSADNETAMQNWSARSEDFEQEGYGFCNDTRRPSQAAKIDADFSLYSTALLLRNGKKSTSTSALPYFQHTAAAHIKNAGYLRGGLDASGDMHLLSRIRGPFTATQWLELEQQALIYKYITANKPIPAHLLIPIVKAFESAGLYGLNCGTFRLTPWGWGPFHLGYSNSNDLEPGRCRRTDGKKWRCTKDAVPNHKYCERHVNRGRHRSRKHVEGQGNGHSVSEATKSATAKPSPTSVVSSSSAQSVLSGGSSSRSFDTNNHNQLKNLQRSASNPTMDASVSRILANRENGAHTLPDATEFSILSQGISLKSNEGSFSNLSEESAPNGFGVLSPGSRSSYDLKHQEEAKLQHQELSMSALAWPEDFTSSTSSPTKENSVWSPLGLSQELEMGLGVGLERMRHAQEKWTSVSWETSMGGPLGEALYSSSFNSRKTSAIHLLEKECDVNGSCQLNSTSPTGVLQKSGMKQQPEGG